MTGAPNDGRLIEFAEAWEAQLAGDFLTVLEQHNRTGGALWRTFRQGNG